MNGPGVYFWLLPFAALIISAGGLIVTIFAARMKSTRDYTDQLRQQLAAKEEELEKCQEHNAALERERNELRSDNYELLRRMIGMPGKPT